MSSVYSLDISPELKEYLVERGQLTKVGDKYLPALMTQRIFDGVVKTRHYIYPAWRNMLDAHDKSEVAEIFQHFGYFWEWFKGQIKDVREPEKKKYRIIRIDTYAPFSKENSRVVVLRKDLDPLDVRNHLSSVSLNDFNMMIEKKCTIAQIAYFFKWGRTKTAKIVKYHKERLKFEATQKKLP